MKRVPTSELKAKLAMYLRMVREGEVIEIQDRGVPIATIRGIEKAPLTTIKPNAKPSHIGRLVSEVKKAPATDIVELLLDERRKR